MRFQLVPGSRSYGYFIGKDHVGSARFLTLQEAKFEAAFTTVREAQLRKAGGA